MTLIRNIWRFVHFLSQKLFINIKIIIFSHNKIFEDVYQILDRNVFEEENEKLKMKSPMCSLLSQQACNSTHFTRIFTCAGFLFFFSTGIHRRIRCCIFPRWTGSVGAPPTGCVSGTCASSPSSHCTHPAPSPCTSTNEGQFVFPPLSHSCKTHFDWTRTVSLIFDWLKYVILNDWLIDCLLEEFGLVHVQMNKNCLWFI